MRCLRGLVGLAVLFGIAGADVSQILAVNIHTLAPVPGELAMISDAGFTTIRMDLAWSQIELAPGKYSWVSVDPFVSALQQHNLSWIAILGPTNPHYDNNTDAHSPAAIAGYAKFAAAFATRYPQPITAGKILLELVNEPNNPSSGIYRRDASVYARLVAATAAAVKAASPMAEVVGPASENIDFAWLTEIFELGVLRHFTQVTVHPYRSDSPETAASDLNDLRCLVDEYASPDAPQITINSGEWGYSSIPTSGTLLNRVAHGKVVARLLLVTISSGMGMSVVYDWRDSPPGPNDEIMGFVENQLQPRPPHHGGIWFPYIPKPAWNATKALAAAIGQYEFVKRLPVFQNGRDTNDDWVLQFRHPTTSAVAFAAWTSASFGHIARIPGQGAGCYAVVNWLGEPQTQLCNDPRGLHLMLTDAPQYLTLKPVVPESLTPQVFPG